MASSKIKGVEILGFYDLTWEEKSFLWPAFGIVLSQQPWMKTYP
jgi:hypothetical protein